MRFRPLGARLVALMLLCAPLACNLPSLSPVRRFTATPRPSQPGSDASATAFPVPPTETPLGQFGPTRTPGPGGPSETPLGSGLTPGPSGTPTPTGTPTATLTATATATAPGGTPTAGALAISDVVVESVRRDSTQPNGAIATVRVFFAGGRGPYRFFDEGQAKRDNPFEVVTTCGASLVHTATITSNDGQTSSKPYFANIACPAS